MERTYCDSTRAHRASVLNVLHGMQQKQQLCDFELRCNDGMAVPVHKCVVLAASGFLRVLMEINGTNEFHVPCEAASTLSQVVRFMYTGELTLSAQSVYGTLNCCMYLGLKQAEQYCRSFLKDNSMASTNELKNAAISIEPISIKREILEEAFVDSYFEEELDEDWKPVLRKSQRKKPRKVKEKRRKRQITQKIEKLKAGIVNTRRRSGRWSMQNHNKRRIPRNRLLRVRSLRLVFHAHRASKRALVYRQSEEGQHFCGLCQMKFHKRSQLLSHYTMHHTKVYKCRHCGSTELSLRSMLLHLKWRHYKSTIKTRHNYDVLDPFPFPYNCHHCDRIFLHNSNLRKHLRQVKPLTVDQVQSSPPRPRSPRASLGSWKCEEQDCQKAPLRFPSCSTLKEHLSSCHTAITYTCPHSACRHKTSVKYLHFKHLRHHENNGNECEICGKCFTNKVSAKNHRFLKHKIQSPGMKIHPCPEDGCGYRAASKTGLRNHFKRHTDNGSYPCQVCGRVLRTQKGLDIHVLRIHVGTKSFMCDQCGQAFFSEVELRNHAEMHNEVKRYTCPMCNYATHVKATFQAHLFNVHRVKHDESMHVLHCDQCPYATTANYRFQDHMRQHVGVRDIPCSQCDKLFITRRTLRNHIKRVHAPKVQCSHCSYKAGETTQLRTHMRLVHSVHKVKPYKCAHCGFTCTLPGNCRKHILQCHPHHELKVIKLTKEQLAERERAETGQLSTEAPWPHTDA